MKIFYCKTCSPMKIIVFNADEVTEHEESGITHESIGILDVSENMNDLLTTHGTGDAVKAFLLAKYQASFVPLMAAEAAANLPALKGGRIRSMAIQAAGKVEQFFNPAQKEALMALWIEGISKGWLKRKGKVELIHGWAKSVQTYYYTQKALVLAAVDSAAVDAVPYDLSPFDATKPAITVQQVKETED